MADGRVRLRKAERRQVEMRMGEVDRSVGAIDAIAIERVVEDDDPVMTGNVPSVGIRPRDFERMTRTIGGMHTVNIFGKFMERVAARGGTAHHDFERAFGHAAEGGAHLGFVMGSIREAQLVVDRFLREKRDSQGKEQPAGGLHSSKCPW